MFGRSKLKPPPMPARLERVHQYEMAAGHIRTEDYRRWQEEEFAAQHRAGQKARQERAKLPAARSIKRCPKCGDPDLIRKLDTTALAWEDVEFADWSGYVRGGKQLSGQAEVLFVACRCGYSAGMERPLDTDDTEES